MTASVVVVSYRPGHWLRACLESVIDQADEVVVVDNGSGGDAAEVAAATGAKVVTTRRNLGFAGGADVGLRAVSGDVVALLNDDAVAGDRWLASAEAVLEDPTVAAVAPKVVLAGRYAEVRLGDERWFAPGDPRALGRRIFAVTVDGRDVLEEVVGAGVHRVETAAGITNEPGEGAGEPGGRWRWTTGPDPFYVPVPDGRFEVAVDGEPVSVSAPLTLINTVGCYLRDDGYAGDVGLEEPDDGRHATVCERFALSGVALAATADTWRRVGPLARPLFAYYEDIDWSWRARRLGLRLRYDPSASVVHHRSATSGGVASARVRFLAERNRLLCLVRNAPWSVASKALRRRVAEGPGYGVRRATGALLPWALATRSRITRRAVLDAAEVWERWAGVDVPRDAAPGA